MAEHRTVWNSLEVAKLATSILTPLTVVLIGFWVQSSIADINNTARTRERLANVRLQIYDDVRVDLNRIYCFVEDVGTWKEDTPLTLIERKRRVDQIMHSHRAFWAQDTFAAYLAYIQSAFAETEGGSGRDARIRTTDKQKRVGIAGWLPEWNARITNTKAPDHHNNYEILLNLISRDMMLTESLDKHENSA